MEQEWEAGKLQEASVNEYVVSGEESAGSSAEEDAPTQCGICKSVLNSPVITKSA